MEYPPFRPCVEYVEVYTTRLVAQEFHVDEKSGDTTLAILGTIHTLLCRIPVKTHVRPQDTFRGVCRLVQEETMGLHSGDQWFMAILGRGATLKQGRCTVVSVHKNSAVDERVLYRQLRRPLWEECTHMGIVGPRTKMETHPLPSCVDDDSREYVWLTRVVDTLMVWYENGKLLEPVCRFASQSLKVNRYVACCNSDMVRMRNGFANLWNRSFEHHIALHTIAAAGQQQEGGVQLQKV